MKNKKILIVAAHPDDEILGCGGLIKKFSKTNQIKILIAGEGITSRENTRSIKKNKDNLLNLKKDAIKANRKLGVNDLLFLDFPDNRFDSINIVDIAKSIEKVFNQFKPSIIFTHDCNDLNQDHTLLHRAVLIAARPKANFFVKKIYTFEVMSSTGWNDNIGSNVFTPNYFVDISNEIHSKLNSLKLYKSELKKWPNARSLIGVKSLAMFRGVQVGLKYAEAFKLLRGILN
jgi:LmbE family N-acetylglucosaminyl deacetylase